MCKTTLAPGATFVFCCPGAMINSCEQLGPVHMIPGQLTDPGVNFASVHGLAPVTVHEFVVAPGQLREASYPLYNTR